ncbi:MAG: hypothetical protein K940chlam7_00547 [Chlamydiae bacterium]|nr:hypothetical protein [Chlamydiota bacterium]
MTSKFTLATKLLTSYQGTVADPNKARRCFIGFDGFTDEIIDAVETRKSIEEYQPMTKMSQFGDRVLEFSGKSCNIELVVREKKIGGNAPILTNALLEGGHRITFAGAIGSTDKIEPLFQEMASRCDKVIPLCPSGHSDAIEFQDGKVILGKHAALIDINYSKLLEHIDKETLTKHLDGADLFVSANWTMLPLMTEIWEQILSDVLPAFSKRPQNRPRWLFVDLADPAKRTDEDIARGLKALKQLGLEYQVILGLNEAEALRIAKVLGSTLSSGEIEQTEALAADIHRRSGLYQIVIHTVHYAIGVNAQETARVPGPYTPTPVLTTGAGDNFNAGFCNGLLYDLSLEENLLSGVHTSGYYVRKGRSPTIPELASFLEKQGEE